MNNYLRVLEDSLRKKLQVLDQIQEYNEKQRQIFQSGQADLDSFDASIEEKGNLIEQITKLDDGFETLYANIAEQLQGNQEKYAEQIRVLQQLITQVTEKSVSVQAQEARNKALMEEYFAKERQNIRQGRKSAKVAYDYYANLNKGGYASPQFMDSKQ